MKCIAALQLCLASVKKEMMVHMSEICSTATGLSIACLAIGSLLSCYSAIRSANKSSKSVPIAIVMRRGVR